MRSVPPAAIPILAVLWLVLLAGAPWAASAGFAALPARAVYEAGSLVCHQKSERSFSLAGIQLPVCGRCLGLYVAGAAGALWGWTRRRSGFAPSSARGWLGVAAVPMAASIGLEWIGGVEGTNLLRFVSALPLGWMGGWLIESVVVSDDAALVGAPGPRAI